jgi:hypothetical protein
MIASERRLLIDELRFKAPIHFQDNQSIMYRRAADALEAAEKEIDALCSILVEQRSSQR